MKTATSLQADALKSCVPPGVRGVAGDDVSFMRGFICRGVCAVGGESLSSATEPVPAPPSRTPKLVPKLVRAAAGGGSGRRRAARGGGRAADAGGERRAAGGERRQQAAASGARWAAVAGGGERHAAGGG